MKWVGYYLSFIGWSFVASAQSFLPVSCVCFEEATLSFSSFFWPWENPWWLKNYRSKLQNLFGSEPYSGRSSSTKPLCSKLNQNVAPQRKSVEIKTKTLEHPRSSPLIASCPTRSRIEEHSCWLVHETPLQSGRIHSHCVESPAYLITLLDAENSAAAPASREEVRVGSRAYGVQIHMRDLPTRHGINVNLSERFPSERLRPDGSLDTRTPAEARDLAMTSLRWWCLTVLPGAHLDTLIENGFQLEQ